MVGGSRKPTGFYEKQVTKYLSPFSMEMKITFKDPTLDGSICSPKAHLVSGLQR